MTPFDELVIRKVMPRVRAWERLHDPHYCTNLKTGQFYELMLEAGYSEEAAQEATNDRTWKRLSSGMTT